MNQENKKRILLIMPYGSVGGMERLALSFYNFYMKKGFYVKALKFIKLENDIINFKEGELHLSDKDFSFMSKKDRLLFYFKAPRAIKAIVKKHNITHSIAFGDMANLFSSLSFSKEYKIGSIHALKSAEFQHKTMFHRLTKLGYKSSYQNLNKLVCISKAIKQDLKQNCGYSFSNMEVIYNPHDVDAIHNLSIEPITEQKEVDIFSKKTILFLGRLSVQKSPWHFIKAFHKVLENLPDINLVIIGDGDPSVSNYVNALIDKLNIKNKVFLLGRKSNPYKYLKASDVLVLSSYYEGTPNVIVESIAVGTPIVSSYCTKGIIELMSKQDHQESNNNIETESGIVTPNLFKGVLKVPERITTTLLDEETKLAEALIKVLGDDNYIKILNNNKEALLDKFDINKVAISYLK
ncbi:Glycosyltransferase involved in cell wall bisynthesis [Algibacter lectus]|uniref:glycosyltransferase n=1 Tax=Algibacter lectus TaxID=221126 RepID=UPI0008EFA3D3|nr:glycosyltransferase [Algibacter lectus]SFC35300.1 Glycosyltransferase involved in cell wall bisynthesis [Algibacter lectus]